MTTLQPGTQVRINHIRENANIDRHLRAQGLHNGFIGQTVKITQSGEFGVAFATIPPQYEANGDQKEWHVYYERAPKIFNMRTAVSPA